MHQKIAKQKLDHIRGRFKKLSHEVLSDVQEIDKSIVTLATDEYCPNHNIFRKRDTT